MKVQHNKELFPNKRKIALVISFILSFIENLRIQAEIDSPAWAAMLGMAFMMTVLYCAGLFGAWIAEKIFAEPPTR